MQDSPAYRLNHEEVIKALEEGILFAEGLSPTECVLDDSSHVKALRFEEQKVVDGKWRSTGNIVELPARSVMIADQIRRNLAEGGYQAKVTHRDAAKPV